MDETFLKTLEPSFYSPDLCHLMTRQNHLLLDCGKVKPHKDVICSAYTIERMSLFIQQTNNHVIPVRLPGIHRARLGGALYKISTQQLIELDKQYKNRLLFERKQIEILYNPYPSLEGTVQVFPHKVWFYAAIPDQWGEQIEMSQRKYNVAPEEPQFQLARTYVDNERMLNNHFRYSAKRMEDYQEPIKPTYATEAVREYVRRKNAEAVSNKATWKKVMHL